MQASVNVAEATLKQAQWELTQTVVTAPVDGWVTNLSARVGNYATAGQPVLLVDSHSFYVVGYFEETKLRHIREGAPAAITLYSGPQSYRVTFPALAAPFTIKVLKRIPGLCRTSSRTYRGCARLNACLCAWSLTVYPRTSRWFPAPPALSLSEPVNEAAGALGKTRRG